MFITKLYLRQWINIPPSILELLTQGSIWFCRGYHLPRVAAEHWSGVKRERECLQI